MTALYALYPDPDSAERAVNALRSAGVAERDITVVSSEPIEEYEFTRRDSATWMPWIAGLGGLVGLLLGAWLSSMTQRAWPIETGGMPIVAWWPNLIIMFELTMLGGILATVITLLVTAGLPARTRGLYDPAVSNGLILVGVENPTDASRADVERALKGGSRL
jgi:hypothetical protein